MRNFLFVLFLVLSSSIIAQITIKVTNVPQYYTPLRDTIYIAGSFNNWASQNPQYMMVPQTDGSYSISINGNDGDQIDFKFTRGGWDRVETLLDGSFKPNTSIIYSNAAVFPCEIQNWNDMLGLHSTVGNMKIIDLDFYMPQLNRTRRIWIYLPNNYYTSQNVYSVMYMHDGQNLFDNVYSFSSEWGIDESMENLYSTFSPTAIIVGIDNGGNDRLNEYSPWVNTTYGGGQGEEYADFITNTLKPYVDANFRTIPDRIHTGIMGSSMGGLISFYTAIAHQDVFGKVGIFSPSFWFSDSVYTFIQQHAYTNSMKMYFYAGDAEGTDMTTGVQNVMTALQNNGYPNSDMTYSLKASGQHNEYFWGSEFPTAYQWLFDGVTNVEKIANNELRIKYLSVSKQIIVENNSNPVLFSIYDVAGKLIYQTKTISNSVDISFLSKACYIVQVSDNKYILSDKIIVY